MLARRKPRAQATENKWKDRAEYDLYDAITKDTAAKSRMDKLQEWESKYPKTDFMLERPDAAGDTYAALGQAKETTEAAKQLLASDPKNFTALYYTMYFTRALDGQTKPPTRWIKGSKPPPRLLANIDSPPAECHRRTMGEAAARHRIAGSRQPGIHRDDQGELGAGGGEFQKCLQLESQ